MNQRPHNGRRGERLRAPPQPVGEVQRVNDKVGGRRGAGAKSGASERARPGGRAGAPLREEDAGEDADEDEDKDGRHEGGAHRVFYVLLLYSPWSHQLLLLLLR